MHPFFTQQSGKNNLRSFVQIIFLFGLLGNFVSPSQAKTPDPLSIGPLEMTANSYRAAKGILSTSATYSDKECALNEGQIALTLPSDEGVKKIETVCDQLNQTIIYLKGETPKEIGILVGCLQGKLDWAVKSAIGTAGLDKRIEGDRKTPTGTYWLGYPKKSVLYGLFIPVGYPNLDDIDLGYTGSAIGIHGPLRFFTCHPQKSLERNWTAGCLAVGRDEQILEISHWVLDHWPVRLEVRN